MDDFVRKRGHKVRDVRAGDDADVIRFHGHLFIGRRIRMAPPRSHARAETGKERTVTLAG